jgi:hypothetical protein
MVGWDEADRAQFARLFGRFVDGLCVALGLPDRDSPDCLTASDSAGSEA